MQKSEIIGIDFRFPTIVVTRKDNRGYALYHKEDTRPYSIQFDGKYLYGELITTNLANEFNAIKASNDPNLVHHEVINTFETPNLRFMENNLFKFDATKLSEKKASLIRIANLLLRYGNIEDIGIALENLLPATKEDGIVLIGGSPLHEIGASKEEYFIYTKKQGHFVMTDYLFSFNHPNSLVSFGNYTFPMIGPSPIGIVESFLLQVVQNCPIFEAQRNHVVNGPRPFWDKYRGQSNHNEKGLEEFDKVFFNNSIEITKWLANELSERGIPSKAYGPMMAISTTPTNNTSFSKFYSRIDAFKKMGIPM